MDPIDLDDQSAIQAALTQSAAPVTPATAAPLGVEDLLDAVPADWRAQAAPPVDPLDDLVDVVPAPRAEVLPTPEELAPDFRRTDYASALDRLAAPRVDPTRAAQTAADAEGTLTALETRQGALQAALVERTRELEQIDAQTASAAQIADPKERKARLAELAEQRTGAVTALDADRTAYQQLGAEVQTAQRARQSARRAYQDELAVAGREGEILAVAAETAAMQAAQAEDQALLRESRAREAELRETEAAAQRQLVEDRRAYRDMLERGPQETTRSTVLAVASVIGEILMARAHGQRPDLVRAIAGVEQATQADFQRRVAARLAQAQDTGDALSRAGQEREIHRAETAARRAEIYETIERDLQVRIAAGRTLSQQAALTAARDDVRAAREAQEAELLAANAQLARKARRDDLEAAKLGAEARLTAAKATREERRGFGTVRAAGTEFGRTTEISEKALLDPVTGIVLGETRFPSKAREDQDTIRGMADTLSEVQEYINLLANTGRVYQGVGAKAVKTSDIASLEAKHAKILADVIRAYSGAAATDAEVERLKKIIPGPKSYTDMGAWDPAKVMREFRDTSARMYENFLGSRLTTGLTMIRGPKGEVLPTSPTFGWRAERGDKPVRTVTGDIVVELNKDADDDFFRSVAKWGKAASEAADAAEREEIITGLESAAEALEATGQATRAGFLEGEAARLRAGKERRVLVRTREKDPKQRRFRRMPASEAAQLDAAEWEIVE